MKKIAYMWLFLSACTITSKSDEKVGIELIVSPIQVFNDEENKLYLTDINLTNDENNLYGTIPDQGVIFKTDFHLSLLDVKYGRDLFPDFSFPSGLVVKGDELFVEDLSNQRLYVFDKLNLDLKETFRLPNPSMGIGLDVTKSRKLVYSIFPERDKTGLTIFDLSKNEVNTSKDFFKTNLDFRLHDQFRLGCICQNTKQIVSIGRFLPSLEILDEDGSRIKSFDLTHIKPLKRAYDTLVNRRNSSPDFVQSNISQNIITSLDCFKDKILIGFTDLIGEKREHVIHLVLLKITESEIIFEKQIKLKTNNEDEEYHFNAVKYNPNKKLLYAQGFETYQLYAFEVDLLN